MKKLILTIGLCAVVLGAAYYLTRFESPASKGFKKAVNMLFNTDPWKELNEKKD